MYFIPYPIKKSNTRGENIYPPRYLCVMYGMSLKEARFQQTAYFFPSWHILNFCLKQRQLAVELHAEVKYT